jgi:IS5 family transposase
MHENPALTAKNRAVMIRTTSAKQLTIAEFDWPFETALDKNNRWVKLSDCIPWDALAESYYQGLPADRGRPLKDARLVIGAVIIKHKLCLSDVETVLQIQENPYLQYFVGLPLRRPAGLSGDGTVCALVIGRNPQTHGRSRIRRFSSGHYRGA